MTANDSVESIVAEMREFGTCDLIEAGLALDWADRLQSAHDAEVGALRAEIAEVREAYQQRTRDWYSQGDAYDATRQRAESAESRLREAERDAQAWRQWCEAVGAEQIAALSEKFGDALGLMRDARRYRWLRERHDSPGDDFAVFKGVTIVDELDAAIAALEAGRSGEARQPDGYAYRYPDGCIRHNNGREVNGSTPTEAIPYYYAAAPQQPPPVGVTDRMVEVAMQAYATTCVRDGQDADYYPDAIHASLTAALSHQQPAPSVSEDRS